MNKQHNRDDSAHLTLQVIRQNGENCQFRHKKDNILTIVALMMHVIS